MKFVLASGNAHKAEEIRAFLPAEIELLLQSELGVESPEEIGTTFIENALIKAIHAARVTGLPSIADDSGLCVNALGGAPGVTSARYAGAGASDFDNLTKLLQQLGNHSNRRAFFHCTLVCLVHPDSPTPLIAQGNWHGEVTDSPKGSSGFGYDPVFLVPELALTAAELDMSEKNRISHRGIALQRLAELISEHL